MTTVEKLLAQIFERKNRIIQQAKQQTDIYTQHLASKCLVDGINPPPWLWNDNIHSSDVPKELNKEDLISEILLPHPGPTICFPSACYSLYNEPIVTGDNRELVDGLFKETSLYSKCFGSGDKQVIKTGCLEDSTGCLMNVVPELDVSITSPQDGTAVSLSNIYSVPDQSVARIQRSKSRQKALELRNSAKASSRNALNQKYDAVASPVRSRLSMFNSELDHVMASQATGEPCVTSCASCGARESHKRDNGSMNKEKGITAYAGTIRRSSSSGGRPNSVKNFEKGNRFTDKSQKSTSLGKDMHDFQQYPNSISASPSLAVFNSDVTAESNGFIEPRTEDYLGHKGKGTDTCADRISRISFASQQTCFLDKVPEVDLSIHSDIVDTGVTAESNDKLVQQFDDIGIPKLLNTSNVAHHRDMKSISGAIEESQVAKHEVGNGSSGTLPFLDTCNADQLGNFETITRHDQVKDESANSRSTRNDAGFKSSHDKFFSDYVVLMEPKQLIFHDREECNLEEKFRSAGKYGNLERLPDEAFDNPLHPASSSDYQVSSGGMISQITSTVEPEVTKEEEIHRGFCETNNKNIDVQIKQKISDEHEDSTVDTSVVDSETELHVPNLKFTCLANIVESNVVENPCVGNHKNIYSGLVYEPELQKEGDNSFKAQKGSQCAFHTSEGIHFSISKFSCSAKKTIEQSEDFSINEVETPAPTDTIIDVIGQECLQENQNLSCLWSKHYSENLTVESNQKILESSNLGGNNLLTHGSVGLPLGDHKNLDLSKLKDIRIWKKSVDQRKLRSSEVDSWPKSKKRKIQDQEADSFSASPSFRVRKHYPSEKDSTSVDLKKAGDNVKTIPGHASPVNESAETEVYQKVACQLNEEMERSPILQHEKNAVNSVGFGEHAETSSSSEVRQLVKLAVSDLTKDPARDSIGCLIKEMNLVGTGSDSGKATGEEDNQYLLHHKAGYNLAYSEGLEMKRSLLEGKSYSGVDGQLSCGMVCSATGKDLDLTFAGEMMPVLESFISDPHTQNEEVNISGHRIDLDKFDFPRTSVECASILEQLCKSTVMLTPLTQFSSAFEMHGSQKFCHSVPNGLLECMDLRSKSTLNEDVHKPLRTIYGNSSKDDLQKMSYSDCLPYLGARFSWDSKNAYASPVGKLWQRMSLHTGSSEKQLSSNPELTCFTIEEDPSTSEENENTSNVTEKIQEESGSLIDTSAKREPLADITEANIAISLSAAEKSVNGASADFVTTEASFRGADKKVKQKLQDYGRNKNEERENNILSLAANGIEKAKESKSSSFSKANLLSKTSLKTERQKLSEKKPKCNNIVSNVNSFIPLVQQKQAVAVCTGKRGIKVKALEAAEVVKRLEERRQNEKKMRKEALKLERARVEQENLRQMELNKKKKAEERKKRDADFVAKKRLREEERKEKERKKKKTEEARRLQREESTLCSQKGERDNKIKKSVDVLKKSQTMLRESRDDVILGKPEAEQWPDELAVDFQQARLSTGACGTSGDSSQLEKPLSALEKSATNDDSVVQNSPEKSYDISPYQCSDEEDEEEENIPNKKFIPSWASKNSVALVLPMQQSVHPDPTVIFPLECFCRIDEVCPSPKAKRVLTEKGQRYQM